MEQETTPQPEPAYHTTPNTPEQPEPKEEVMMLSSHSVEGSAGHITFSLLWNIDGHQDVALVDTGSSHTFMNYSFAISSNYDMQPFALRKVAVVGGGQLISEATIPLTAYNIQGYKFSSIFKILPLQSYRIILGANWIYHLSPIGLDLQLRILTITRNGMPITFIDHTAPQKTSITTPASMRKIMSTNVMGYIIQVYELQEEQDSEATFLITDLDLQALLNQYTDILDEKSALPPTRDCDHMIPLLFGAQPPNLRLYRVLICRKVQWRRSS